MISIIYTINRTILPKKYFYPDCRESVVTKHAFWRVRGCPLVLGILLPLLNLGLAQTFEKNSVWKAQMTVLQEGHGEIVKARTYLLDNDFKI